MMRARMRRKQHEHHDIGDAEHNPQPRASPTPGVNAQTDQPEDDRKRPKNQVGNQQTNQPTDKRHRSNRNRLTPRLQPPGPPSPAPRPGGRRRTSRLGSLSALRRPGRSGTPSQLGRSGTLS
jgi:hypothetical protein